MQPQIKSACSIVLGALLGIALSSAAFAQAQNRLDEVIARGTIRIASTGDYKPFSYKPAGGDAVGLDVELAEDLAKSLNVKLQAVSTSWPTLMKDFAAGQFDVAISGISVTLDRQKLALFSIPYMRDGKTPITRCEQRDKFQTLDQIDHAGVKLIVNPGGTNEKFARANIKSASITVYPDNVTIFDRVLTGEADLMITDSIETRLQQQLHPGLCAVHPDQPFDFSEKAVLLPRDLIFKAYVDQWMHQQIESGAYKQKLDRWLAYPWPLETLRQGVDQRLSLMVDVAKYKWNKKEAIEDLPREAQIISKLADQAQNLGVNPKRAETFFRAQIEASKTLQREYFERWKKEGFTEGVTQFENVPDLAREIRPKLDALTPVLMAALKDAQPMLEMEAGKRRQMSALLPLHSAQLSAAAAAQALEPLTKY